MEVKSWFVMVTVCGKSSGLEQMNKCTMGKEISSGSNRDPPLDTPAILVGQKGWHAGPQSKDPQVLLLTGLGARGIAVRACLPSPSPSGSLFSSPPKQQTAGAVASDGE